MANDNEAVWVSPNDFYQIRSKSLHNCQKLKYRPRRMRSEGNGRDERVEDKTTFRWVKQDGEPPARVCGFPFAARITVG